MKWRCSNENYIDEEVKHEVDKNYDWISLRVHNDEHIDSEDSGTETQNNSALANPNRTEYTEILEFSFWQIKQEHQKPGQISMQQNIIKQAEQMEWE